jgi:hypothetical protein
LVPLFEGTIGRYDERFAFITAVDDFIEQIGCLVVERKVADLIDTEQTDISVGAEFAAAALQCLTVESVLASLQQS